MNVYHSELLVQWDACVAGEGGNFKDVYKIAEKQFHKAQKVIAPRKARATILFRKVQQGLEQDVLAQLWMVMWMVSNQIPRAASNDPILDEFFRVRGTNPAPNRHDVQDAYLNLLDEFVRRSSVNLIKSVKSVSVCSDGLIALAGIGSTSLCTSLSEAKHGRSLFFIRRSYTTLSAALICFYLSFLWIISTSTFHRIVSLPHIHVMEVRSTLQNITWRRATRSGVVVSCNLFHTRWDSEVALLEHVLYFDDELKAMYEDPDLQIPPDCMLDALEVELGTTMHTLKIVRQFMQLVQRKSQPTMCYLPSWMDDLISKLLPRSALNDKWLTYNQTSRAWADDFKAVLLNSFKTRFAKNFHLLKLGNF
eukprot:TRINITY_DN239_c0_g1_i2.p1 TRINITY_DN239_c0_g1~~TRINITY_DN239_c0_g1_i2.p1  ORF type:complete len:364 (+),score=33.57 TRINITY_DN239_c0_g1_i2:1121-2212(+)